MIIELMIEMVKRSKLVCYKFSCKIYVYIETYTCFPSVSYEYIHLSRIMYRSYPL